MSNTTIPMSMPIHLKDDLIAGITLENLIITLQSNEETIDRDAVLKVFNELIRDNMDDARSLLHENMELIIKEAKGNDS